MQVWMLSNPCLGLKDILCQALEESPSPLEGLAYISNVIIQSTGLNASEWTAQGALDETAENHQKIAGVRQFFYQQCTEYGFWTTANANSELSIKSSLLNLNYYRNICKRAFGIERPPQTDLTNARYYNLLINPSVSSNILFSNGTDDGWSKLSISSLNGNDSNKSLSYVVIKDAAHMADLALPSASDTKSQQEARIRFETLLDRWFDK